MGLSYRPTDWILGDDRRLHRGEARRSMDLGWSLARTYCGAAALRGISGLLEVEVLEDCGVVRCEACESAVSGGAALPSRPRRSAVERPRILPARVRDDGEDGYDDDF